MKKRKLTAIISLLLLLPCLVLPVSANSAQQHWSGTDASGAIITDGDSPIVVEKELLTFDLAEFPANYYQEQTDFLAYTGKVTAEYTFYNPSDMTVTATLAFPFGNLPDYANNDSSDIEKYDVTVNGEAIEKTVRHTLSASGSKFNVEENLSYLKDDYITHGIYSPDTTVTVYSWKINYTPEYGEKITNPTFACDIGKSDGRRTIYFPRHGCGHVQDNGEYRMGGSLKYADPILYVFGEPLEELPRWTLYTDGGCEDGEEIGAEFTFYESKTMTLLDFALQNRGEDSHVSEIDWYNAVVVELNSTEKYTDYPVVSMNGYERGYNTNLMRWYQYEITLEPGERIVNAVTAPMYPAIDMSYVPTVFEYTYLISPASTWSEFGELKIVINTPYYLTDYSYQGFEKTDSGYELTIDGLPTDGEGKVTDLIFSLSTEEDPKTPAGISRNIVYFLAFYGLPLFVGMAVIAVILLIIRKIIKK